jgi:hypothetical protein
MRSLLLAVVVSLTILPGPVLAQKQKAKGAAKGAPEGATEGAAKVVGKVATEEEVDEKIKVADSSAGPPKIRAVEWFSSVRPPNEQVKAKVSRKLGEWLDDKESSVRGRAADALANWATEELIPRMMTEMVGNQPALRKGSIVALGRLQHEKAIPAMIRDLESGKDRPQVTEALVAMGPKAEPAVIKVLDHKNQGVVRQACLILTQMGTSKSLPALGRIAGSKNKGSAVAAANAIDAIKDREAGGGNK